MKFTSKIGKAGSGMSGLQGIGLFALDVTQYVVGPVLLPYPEKLPIIINFLPNLIFML